MDEPKRRLSQIDVTWISLVDKGANKKRVIYKSKNSPEEPSVTKTIPIIKVDEEKHLVYGIVYSPEETDSQGDVASADEIEKAAHAFMKNARTNKIDKHHTEVSGEGYVAESWITRENDALFPDEPADSWAVAIKVESDETWNEVKKGEIEGLSLMGIAQTAELEKSENKIWNWIKEKIGISKDFKSIISEQNIRKFSYDLCDAFYSAVHEIFSEEYTGDKKDGLIKTVEQMKEYIDDNFDSKAVAKAGRKISGINEKAILNAIKALNDLLETNTVKKEELEMTPEEIKELVKTAVDESLKTSVEALKKDLNEQFTAKVAEMEKAQKEAGQKLEAMEKSVGSNQEPGQEDPLKKEEPESFIFA